MGVTSCKVSNACNFSFYQSAPVTSTTSRQCTACTIASACPRGTALQGQCSGPALPPSNPTCVTCDGLLAYQDQAGASACKTVTVCNSSAYQVKAPTSTSDRLCAGCTPAATCQPGQFLNGTCSGSGQLPFNPSCLTCPAGHYQEKVPVCDWLLRHVFHGQKGT